MENYIIPVGSLLIALFALLHTLSKDDKQESKGIVEANVKLDQICNITSEIKADVKSMDRRINEFDTRLTVVEHDVKGLKEKEL